MTPITVAKVVQLCIRGDHRAPGPAGEGLQRAALGVRLRGRDETRKRAGEIVGLRTVNEGKFLAKEDFYKGKWETIRHAQAQNA